MGYLGYWGKAKPIGDIQWHPLAYHGLDVAATVTVYLQKRPRLLERFAGLLGLTHPQTLRLVQFLAAVHDLGKFSWQFQSKHPTLFALLFPGEKLRAESKPHAPLGLGVLVAWLQERAYPNLGDAPALKCLVNAACGHHGQPVDCKTFGAGLGAAQEYLNAMHEMFEPVWPALDDRADAVREASWLLAGLFAQCDWVGSSQHFFPYTAPLHSPAEYFCLALQRAERAITELRLECATPASSVGFEQLFPLFARPSPLQSHCDTVSLGPPGSVLYLLEDETGAGKTEAALTLAARLLASGYGQGVLMALPSQSTADALYKRLLPLARKLFAPQATPSMVLAHGGGKLFLSQLAQSSPELASISEQLCSWAQDNNKSALLADFGVATIDQVVMGVLATRHTAMRQLGLLDKVLIVDEVHACEPYLLALLEQVLTRHATRGGSAILLSATLPAAARTRLIAAFRRGVGGGPAPALASDYPLATCVTRTQFEQVAIAAAKASRTLRLEPVDEARAYGLIEEWLGQGKCVALFKNTVKSAQAAYRHFAERFPGQVTLVHARYAARHRGENDASLLERFGPQSGAATRRGQLVIATQVGEQSLDLDFDEAVSDLAPLDALLQRFGRRRRHARDRDGHRNPTEQRGDSPAWVIMPSPESARFFEELPFGTTQVYYMRGVLRRTARIVAEVREIVVPAGVRAAVDDAYNEEDGDATAVRARDEHAQGRRMADTGQARLNALKFDAGYDPAAGEFSDRAASVTRLGAESLRVVLCDENAEPLFGDMQQSAVSLRAGLLALTPDAEGNFRLRLSQEAANRWAGVAQGARDRCLKVRYSRDEGLSVEKC